MLRWIVAATVFKENTTKVCWERQPWDGNVPMIAEQGIANTLSTTALPSCETTRIPWNTPFTAHRILLCFVQNALPKCIASKDFVGSPVRAHFASRHPKKNNVLLKTQKSEFSRQTDQESGPRTSGAKPVWAKITFFVNMNFEETRKQQILRATLTCFVLQFYCFASTRPYVLQYFVETDMLLHQKNILELRKIKKRRATRMIFATRCPKVRHSVVRGWRCCHSVEILD